MTNIASRSVPFTIWLGIARSEHPGYVLEDYWGKYRKVRTLLWIWTRRCALDMSLKSLGERPGQYH